MKNFNFHFTIFMIVSLFTNAQTRNFQTLDYTKNAVIYEVNIRQYSKENTFNKVTEDLDRLKKLGVDIIWLMPIHPIGELNRKGTEGSYYAVKDYKAVNPEFGTMQDFKNLVNIAHQKGIKVIIDWVANHSSPDNVWIKEHLEYYTKDEKGNAPIPTLGTDWYDVADLNYDNIGLRNAMQEAMIFWLKETDIDGFRCDVAELVPLDFWVETRKKLQAIKPVFMLAEGSKEELFAAFDMTYNWQLTDLMIEANKFEKKSVQDIAIFRENFFKSYQPDWIVMNFTTNHDKNSWDFLEKDVFGNNRLNYAALTFLMNGMPLIYTGQESGLDKKVQFFEKDAVNWGNYKYQNFYQKLIKIYKNNPALWNGKFKGNFTNYPQQNSKVLVFEVFNEKSRVVAMQNYSDASVSISVKSLIKKLKLIDKISDKTIKKQKNYITIPAHSQYIFTN